MKEEWKDIEGYEGYYQVSNLGRVRSVDREIYKTGDKEETIIVHYKGKVLSQGHRHKGYLCVVLAKNSKLKSFAVHRLVAQAFIPNPYNLPQINHKDEDKTNNCVENLEWCDCRYNINYGSWREKQSKSHKGKYTKKIVQLSKSGKVVRVFDSITEAEKVTGIRHISAVACGHRKYSGGYAWRFLNEYKIPENNGEIDAIGIERSKYGRTVFPG